MNAENPTWCSGSLLKMDQACLSIHHIDILHRPTAEIELWGQSIKCQECPLWKYASIKAGQFATLAVNTTYPTLLEVKQKGNIVCNFTHHFGEFGLYSMNKTADQCSAIITDEAPANSYLPLLWTALAIFLAIILWRLKCIIQQRDISWCSCFSGTQSPESTLLYETSPALIPPDPAADQPSRHRIRCLDAFRGLTIVFMILVNYGGGGYWFLEHAPWNGLTIADVIFPCFVWIMGSSCVLSLNSQLRRALPRRRILLNILRRSAVMFFMGLMLNSLNNNNITMLRIPGVLQRLSFVFLVVALIELMGFDPEDNQRYAWFAAVRDVVCSWRQWIVVTTLVIVQLLVTFLVPVPGCPLGYLGAGGLEKGAKYRNCTGGSARLVDVTLFTSSHIYQRPTPRTIYDTSVPYDPEGLLGAFTCVLCAYLGAEAAKVLLVFQENNQRIARWLTWSVATGLLGGALCSFKINDGLIPINKNLWSLSYVLVTSSIAFGLFTLLYFLIDVMAWWSGAPFRYAGMNAMLLYVGHILARPLLPFSWGPLPSTHAAHLAMNCTGAAIWVLISWALYRKRVFVSL